MNSLEQFNKIYAAEKSPVLTSSLVDFLTSIVLPKLERLDENRKLQILDLGPGQKSIFEENTLKEMQVSAIDYSSVAIEYAQKMNANKSVNYKNLDVTIPQILGESLYDVVFDSHCLHCITDSEKRTVAFKNIYEALNPEGLFCAEMMVQPMGKTIEMPMKYVPITHELEQEILGHGFKIFYFMIVRNLNFTSENGDCDLLRVIAKK